MIVDKEIRSYCPEALIESATEGGWLRSLALYCVMKNRFSAWFYDKSSAADKLNIPKTTFNRLLKPLLTEGLVYHDGVRYRLLTRPKINKKYNTKNCCTIIIKPKDSLTSLTYKLRLKIIEKFSRQQNYNSKVFKLIDSSKAGATKALKRFKCNYEAARQQRIDKIRYKELLNQSGFTLEWLANELNCSKETARRTLLFGKVNNLCGIRTLCKAIKRMTYQEYKRSEHHLRESFSSLVYKGGYACYNVCTLYTATKYWFNIPNSLTKYSSNSLDKV